MTYAITVCKINDEGRWEEWEQWLEGEDGPAALAKFLRRKASARFLLEGGTYRFNVEMVQR
jgi:hypothetical protein